MVDRVRGQGPDDIVDLRGRAADADLTCRSLCRLVVPALADLAAIYMIEDETLIRTGSAAADARTGALAEDVPGGLRVAMDDTTTLGRAFLSGQPAVTILSPADS